MKRLSETELEIMNVFWETDCAMTRAELTRHWKAGEELHINTVATFLSRLEEKGFLQSEKQGRANCYHAVVSREQYFARNIWGKFVKLSAKELVMNFCDVNKLSKKELKQLEEIMDKLERETEKENK